MWKYNGKTIRAGQGWTDDKGVQHPRNWNIWSEAEKLAAGVIWVTPETPPDSRLYHWSKNSDGTVTSSAKNLDDVNEVDADGVAILDDDGVQLVTLGVKSTLTSEVKSQQGSLLAQTDWAVTRKAEKATAIPANVVAWRDAIRVKATAMEDAISAASDTAAMAALFLSWDIDGNKSGVLFDWPEIG